MIESVLFDLDGTLLNTTEGVLESAIYAAKNLGYEELPHETMLSFVGPPIQNSFMKWYGCDSDKAQEAANVFRSYYKENALFKASLYPGIVDLLKELKERGIKIGVATYKREDYAISILEHFGIAPYCQSMHGADNFNKLTKADIVNICIHELSAEKGAVVLIGDTEHDAKGAEVAGVPFIAVTFGFGFKNADDVNAFPNVGYAETARDIIKIIEKI